MELILSISHLFLENVERENLSYSFYVELCFVKFIKDELSLSTMHGLDDLKVRLCEKIAGEIALSDNPGETIRKWRETFGVSQSELSAFIRISPSVISDYESGRRRSPGIHLVKKLVSALVELDGKKGYTVLKSYQDMLEGGFNLNVIIDMREYDKPLHVSEFAELIEGNLITYYNRMLNGHTIIDSLRAILELNSFDFYKLYGWNSERALMFTQVSTGRSPMVAVRVASLKPAAVVLHGIKKEDIDRIAVKISEIEQIPLICSNLPIKQLIEKLRSDAV